MVRAARVYAGLTLDRLLGINRCLSRHALAMRCPVLVLPIVLCVGYAMSSTDIGYAITRCA
eukprot:3938282-Rhodomonas_salina.1